MIKSWYFIVNYLQLVLVFNLFAQEPDAEISQLINQKISEVEQTYYYLHQNPELSFLEKNTSVFIAKQLRSWGFEVVEKVGGYGVVGVLKNGAGPTVMLRTDMDALPVKEETGLSYACKKTTIDINGNEVPVMHACGHDIHMSVFLGTAQVLTGVKEKWQGTLLMIAQPAEERSGGAKAMLKDGLFTKFPRPDFALALHTNATMQTGKVGVISGYAMANVDMVDITVFGKGGHGAYPHTTIDPVVLASRMILDFQTIVSRQISPLEPAVLTVGSIHGGTKGNVIPDEVKLELTLRSYSDEVRNKLIDNIIEVSKGIAMSAGLEEDLYPQVTVRDESTPSLYNDPQLTERMTKIFRKVLGSGNVESVTASMVGEDFGRYGRVEPHLPIMIFWLGTIGEQKIKQARQNKSELPSLHSGKFAPEPKTTLITGMTAMSHAVLELMQ